MLDLDKKTWDEIFEWHKKFQEDKKTKQNLEKKTGNEAKICFNKWQKRRTDGIKQQMQTDDVREKTLAKNRHQYIKTDITEKQNWIRQNNPRQRLDLPSDSWKAKEYLNVYK